jgi:hypothetical protein
VARILRTTTRKILAVGYRADARPCGYQCREVARKPSACSMRCFLGCNLPAMLLYGALCRRSPLSRRLWWGTVLGILQPAVGNPDSIAREWDWRSNERTRPGRFAGPGHSFVPARFRRDRDHAGNGGLLFALNLGNLFGSWVYAQEDFQLLCSSLPFRPL